MSDFDQMVNDLISNVLDIGERDPHALTLLIEGQEVPCISGRVKRSIDTAADGFSVVVKLNETYQEYPFTPFGYEKVELFLGTELVITGRLYVPDISFNTNDYSATLEGASYAADIVDSKLYPPLEYNFTSLSDLAEKITSQTGMKIEFEADSGNEFFDRACCENDETIFSFLQKLASQRALLVTSTNKGNLQFVRANINGSPLCTLGDEKNPITSIRAKFNGRNRFHSYKATSHTPIRCQCNTRKRKKKTYVTKTEYKSLIILDPEIPESRQTSKDCDDVTVGNAELSARYAQRKAYADSLTIQIPVNSWYVPGKDILWSENQLVTVQSPAIFLKNGYDLLIRSVEYVYSNSGCTALLDLVPPQCFSTESIPSGIFSPEGPSELDAALADIGISGGIGGLSTEIR